MSVNDWTLGAAPLLQPSTRNTTELVVSLSDIHVPFQDHRVVHSAIKLIKELQPHRVVINGDTNDFFQLSRFNTELSRLDSLQDELDEGNRIRAKIRKAAPNAEIIETLGNHDSRLLTYVATHARALTSLRALEPCALLQHKELEIESFPGHGFRLRENFLVKHGSIIRSEVPASGKAELLASGLSGWSGHTHRLGTYRKGGYRASQWTEQGCLCLLTPDYVVGRPNWTQGCVVGQFSTKSDAFLVEEVQALDGKLVYGGRSF